VFRYSYRGVLEHLALAQQLSSLNKRSFTICYEDLSSADKDLDTINEALNFWFDGDMGSVKPWNGKLPGHKDYSGGHSTSHDPELRQRLVDVIKILDAKHYNNEIAWVDSVLPC